MIRAFIGVTIDPSVAGKISETQAKIERKLSGIRWVGQDKLHFTLKFLGPIAEAKGEPITEALEEALTPFSRFSILARGMGVFPDIRKPRVLWVGLEGPKLKSLALEIEAALEAIGFSREKREFKPHLTIGRWKSFGGRPEPLRSELESWKDYEFGKSWVEKIVFFQSILKPEGAIYRPLSVIRLRSER